MKSEKTPNGFVTAMKLAFKDNWMFMILFAIISGLFASLIMRQSSAMWQNFSGLATETEKNIGEFKKYFEIFQMGYGSYNNQVLSIYSELLSYMVIVIAFVAFFVVLKNFSFLYSKRKADLIFSLPIKRTETVVAKIICCFLSVFVAFAVLLVPLFVVPNGFVSVEKCLLLLLGGFAQCLAIMSAFIFCAVACGRVFSYAVLSIFTLVLPFASKLPLLIRNFYIPNYAFPREQYRGETARWLYFFIAFALVSLAVVAFKKRKSESAEGAVAFRLPVSIAVLSVQLFGFFIVPLVLASVRIRLSYSVIFLISFAVMVVLTVIAELVLDKFRRKRAVVIQLVTVSAVLLAVSLGAILLNSKVTEKPENLRPENVEKVVLYASDRSSYYDTILRGSSVDEMGTIIKPKNIIRATQFEDEHISDKVTTNYVNTCFVMKNGKYLIRKISIDKVWSLSIDARLTENNAFVEADFGNSPIMLVTKWIDMYNAKTIIIRDKLEIEKIRMNIEMDTEKIMRSSNDAFGEYGAVHVIALNDKATENVRQELESMTDEQLHWALTNGSIKEKYGKTYYAYVIDRNSGSIAQQRGTQVGRVRFDQK